jgi:hypothetical protein
MSAPQGFGCPECWSVASDEDLRETPHGVCVVCPNCHTWFDEGDALSIDELMLGDGPDQAEWDEAMEKLRSMIMLRDLLEESGASVAEAEALLARAENIATGERITAEYAEENRQAWEEVAAFLGAQKDEDYARKMADGLGGGSSDDPLTEDEFDLALDEHLYGPNGDSDPRLEARDAGG